MLAGYLNASALGELLGDRDAHGTSGAGDDLLGALDVVGVEVRHLNLGDLGELLLRELANLVALGNAGATLEAELLLDELSGGRRLADEREGAVLVDGDLNLSCVAALNAWQNCMMLTWAAPRAGPIGGAGLAAPAGIWSLMKLTTFFSAIVIPFHCEVTKRVPTCYVVPAPQKHSSPKEGPASIAWLRR